MTKKHVSRGRGPRIREEELDRMIALYREGKSFKAIGVDVGRHWQTVRKYTIKALQERPGDEVRREALKDALINHFQTMVGALESVIGLMTFPEENRWSEGEWQIYVPERRNRLLLRALRECHAKDSSLWASWDRWNEGLKAYQKELGALHIRVVKEIQALQKANSGTGITLTDYLKQVLFRRGASIGRGSPIYDPSLLKVSQRTDVKDGRGTKELWLGTSTHLATGNNMARLVASLSDIMMKEKMGAWAEVVALHKRLRSMTETKDDIEEQVEILSLRGAFPGRCEICPI